MSTPESTPTHLLWATLELCQSRPFNLMRELTLSPSQGLLIWTLYVDVQAEGSGANKTTANYARASSHLPYSFYGFHPLVQG
jgi:hypothetical protein